MIAAALAGFEKLAARLALRAKALVEVRKPDRIDWRDARQLWPRFTGEA
ncbi:MAG: hypothetical protein ACREBO_08185 [Novosphingobium sp.]